MTDEEILANVASAIGVVVGGTDVPVEIADAVQYDIAEHGLCLALLAQAVGVDAGELQPVLARLGSWIADRETGDDTPFEEA